MEKKLKLAAFLLITPVVLNLISFTNANALWDQENNKPPKEIVIADKDKSVEKKPEYAPGEIIIKFKDDADVGAVADRLIEGKQLFKTITGDSYLDDLNKKYNVKKMQKLFSQAKGEISSGIISKQQAQAIRKDGQAEYKNKIEAIKQKFFKRAMRIPANVETPYLNHIYRVELGQKDIDAQIACAEYAKDPAVAYAQPNYIVQVSVVPNDPLYSQQWAHQNINSQGAWDISVGNSDVIIAVVDTGIDYNHEDLAANIWKNQEEIPNNGLDDDANGYIDDYYGYDFYNNDGDPIDDYGHGTHCAGIAAAVTNNALGVAGVAWEAKIMTVKFLSVSGSGTSSGGANGILYAADNGADVISNSWGGGGYDAALKDAIDYAYSLGCFLVAAAGNNNSSLIFYPAGYENMFSVAATDSANQKASFSNFGNSVDVAAPGVNIMATMPQYEVTLNKNYGYSQNYAKLSGTSMACPHVAGLAALLVSKNSSYTPGQIRDIIKVSVNNPVNSTEYIGSGIINSLAALTTAPIPAGAAARISSPGYASTVSGTVIPISGSATGVSYQVVYSTEGPYSTNWIEIGSGAYVEEGELAQLNTSGLESGTYWIKLLVRDATAYEFINVIKVFLEKDMLTGWPQLMDQRQANVVYSSPLCADLDGDGDKELFCVTYFGGAYLWNADGSIASGWPKLITYPNYSAVFSSAAFADMDQDSDLEILLTTSYYYPGVHAWHHDGTNLSGWPKIFSNNQTQVPGSPIVGDINGDQKPDVVAATYEINTNTIKIYAWDRQGNLLPGWPFVITGEVNMWLYDGNLALADFDGDGDMEVVALASDNKDTPNIVYIYVLNGDAVPLPNWPQTRQVGWAYRPSVGDVNNDGSPEIFFGSGEAKVYGLDANGNDLPGWPIRSGLSSIYSGITLADLDDDGDLEITFLDIGSMLWVYHHNGTLASGWPKDLANVIVLGYQFWSSPAVGDVDGDGRKDVVVGSEGSSEVYAFNKDGVILPKFPKHVGDSGYPGVPATPSIDDFDGDGNVDIMITGTDNRVYVWGMSAPFNQETMEWPTFQHDRCRTGWNPIINEKDWIPPQVSITSPQNNAIVSGVVDINATASDNVGVTKVEFYVDSSLKGADVSAPYSYAWDTAGAAYGSHVLKAVAYDAAGNTGSSTVTVTINPPPDNIAPQVAITSPKNASVVKARSKVTIAATATDNVGVSRVEFYVNNTLLAIDQSSPYSCVWTVPAGAKKRYTLTAVAYDTSGNNATSSVTVTSSK